MANQPTAALEGLNSLDPDRGWFRGWNPYWVFRLAALHQLENYEEEARQAQRAAERFPGRWLDRPSVGAGSLEDMLRVAEDRPPEAGTLWMALEMKVHGHDAAVERYVSRYRRWASGLPPERFLGQRVRLASVLALVEEWDEAIRLLRELRGESPQRVDVEGKLGAVLAIRGDDQEAQQISKRLTEEDAVALRGLPTIWRARIAAALGQRTEAVELLEIAFAQGSYHHFNQPGTEQYWHSDPDLSLLEGYPPYDELVRPDLPGITVR